MMNRPRPLHLVLLAILTLLFLSGAIFIFISGRTPIELVPPKPVPIGQAPQALRLTVRQSGVVAISQEQVHEATLPFESFSAEGLSLTRDGVQVPFLVRGEGRDGVLYFYAQAITNTLEAPAVYWLAPGTGTAMPQWSAIPADAGSDNRGEQTARWEENKVFLSQAEGDDLWLGQLLFAPSSLDVALDGIHPNQGTGQLKVRLWSNNQAPPNPDHHVELQLNGQKLADQYWEGIAPKMLSVPLAAGILQPKDNLLTIVAPGDTGAPAEQLFVDWVELTYESELNAADKPVLFRSQARNIQVSGVNDRAILLDVTDPAAPRQLIGAVSNRNRVTFAGEGPSHRYLVLNPKSAQAAEVSLAPQWDSLRDPARAADYLAIVADVAGFREALQPLLDHRRLQGYQVLAVPASQVFDEFGGGRQTPEAIRRFLAYATANWQTPPRFVLLVGDASYDVNDFLGGQNRNLLPTYLVNTRFAGYVASDTWFTLLDNDELSPSLAIGRFPVQTAEQLASIVNKTIAYERSAEATWTGRALLVADDEASFNVASDRLANELVSVGYQAQKLYMTENDDTAYNHDAIVSALNQGVGIVNYVGHGSIEVWGDEKVFEADDAARLANQQRLPIFTTFTCLNGYFNHPQVDALAETLLWAEDAGIVAAVAPSGRSTTSQQVPLADEFYGALLSGEAPTLGEALQLSKIAAARDEGLGDVIHTFNLLGDPALRFHLPLENGS